MDVKTSMKVLLTLLIVAIVVAIGFLLLIRRGFRATSAPSARETFVASAVRNLAIPRHDRNVKNPFKVSSDTIQQGREYFLTRCAICHGIDGSGKTQMGRISIRECPICARPQRKISPTAKSTTSSKMECSLQGCLPGAIRTGSQTVQVGNSFSSSEVCGRSRAGSYRSRQASISTAHYVGSQACEKCHAQIYQRWKKTPMANVVRDPRTHPDAIIPNLATNNVAKFTKDQVAFVYGSIWKQRYFTKVGDDYFPLAGAVGHRQPQMAPVSCPG